MARLCQIEMEMSTLKFHCILAFSFRVLLVFYSNFHDKIFSVPYTDVDYKVFTDAARYLLDGSSPFDRHTYRYSPLLALLLTPNIFLSSNYGKILFSFVDILVAILIQKVVLMDKNQKVDTANKCACLWLYNPLTIIISTRGNADCLAAFLVILSLYFLLSGSHSIAGLIHGISVHFRLYPVTLSMAMYFSLRKLNGIFVNINQIKFTLTCLISLTFLTALSYHFFGYKYIFESMLYHIIRKDTRHNFSIFFYPLYLSANSAPSQLGRIFNFLPQLILLITFSGFYSSKRNLSFALMMQVFVVVMYNAVMTSQYFFWFLSLFPLCFPKLKCSLLRMLMLFGIWIVSQGSWLLMAYALEFQSFNSFNYIWISSMLFFIINIKVLVNSIQVYQE